MHPIILGISLWVLFFPFISGQPVPQKTGLTQVCSSAWRCAIWQDSFAVPALGFYRQWCTEPFSWGCPSISQASQSAASHAALRHQSHPTQQIPPAVPLSLVAARGGVRYHLTKANLQVTINSTSSCFTQEKKNARQNYINLSDFLHS